MTETTPAPVPQEDNLAQDLIELLKRTGLNDAQQQRVLDSLVPYIVDRDHKILIHGYQSGRASA